MGNLGNTSRKKLMSLDTFDITDEKQFPEMYSWLLQKARKFAKAFQEVIGSGT